MEIREVVAAVDETPAGRQAAISAAQVAARAGARLVVLRVLQVSGQPQKDAFQEELKRSFLPDLLRESRTARTEFAIAYGLPGIEIAHFAEARGADLLVLGRKTRSQLSRMLAGDTADAVARRSQVPCLFVAERTELLNRVLVALDGTERGFIVAGVANDFTRITGGRLRAVTVEPVRADEVLQPVGHLPDGRTAKLAQSLDRLWLRDPAGCNRWDPIEEPSQPLRVRRGDAVEEILSEITSSRADTLVVGYRRGGPPGVLEAGSVSRRLAHEAPCSVLTVPL